ncbi:dipeptide/oligopeptide/nickel ABC transporter permease/ATP-binding protein [Microlunatus soli]|uniref:ABC-type dipeptide/oligopeptide/nickel transport system, ATPase component n=1 Tax=Microlunatus soli TaxID=630515 RepID=A0A1H1UCZ4_9ACTN|nr:dipeptide/oligopeptide/nickel ABC transporter permease/ATP-binding protein [Microlunatus soli]SDS70076.1 ABC-type dipeptide/oligopeptide/nickel transport system, ATPase component [Microlunatus soli]
MARSSIKKASRLRSAFLSPIGIAAALGLVVLAALTIIAPAVWGSAASTADPYNLSRPPSAQHWLGTDAGGRDIGARTLVATRLSILMALAATAIGVSLGVVVGCLPTVLGRRTGRMVTAAVNLAIAFPGLLLVIMLAVIMGQGLLGAILAIGLAIIPAYGRLTQTLSASVAGRDYIAAARILGISRPRILFRHVLPNVREPLIVNASITAGGALIAFAGLSFLGLGVQPPSYDWGRLLNEGIGRIWVTPGAAVGPAVAVVFAGVTFTLLGETLARGLGIERRVSRLLPPKPARAGGPVQVGSEAAEIVDHEGVAGVSHSPSTSPGPRSVVDSRTGPQPVDGFERVSGIQPVLRVRGLRVDAPTDTGWRRPVRDVGFDIAPGEIVGLVGESGSGKSLTCLSVAGLLEEPLQVTAEEITFDGLDLAPLAGSGGRVGSRRLAAALGTRMALVFQDPMASLNPALRVGPQVAEIGLLHEGLDRQTASERAIDRLDAVRIPDPRRRARQYPHEYSGGMRQRAMLAMGLMGTPSLIIADEPTTALDVTVQQEVLRLLHQVSREAGSAVLFVSHDIAVVTGLCTRVLVMFRGEIVEQIAVDDLVAGRAEHPYTQALLAAVPSMTGDRNRPLATIGDLP